MALWKSIGRPVPETKDAVSRRHSVGSTTVWAGAPVQMPMGSLDVDRAVNDGWKRIVWVYRCIDARAKNLARTRMAVFNGRGEGAAETEGHPLSMLLNRRANPYESAFAFRYRFHTQADLSERGVFVEVVCSRRGDPIELHLLHPKFTFPIADPDQFVSGYEFRNPSGEVNELKPYREGEGGVLWFKRPHPTDPYLSSTWLNAAGISMDIDFYARLYNRNFMLNDGKPGGMVVVDGGEEGIDDETADMLQARFAGGVDRAGRLTVVEAEGASYVDLSTTPRDAQYVESRALTKAEILAAAGTPESVFNAAGRTYDNADAELEGWWLHELVPEGEMAAQTYEELTPGGILDDSEVVGYVWDEVPALKRAQKEREDRAASDFMAGLISVDEYREITHKEALDLPGTRVLWLASGKAPVGTAEDVAAILGTGGGAAPPPGAPPGELPPGGGDTGGGGQPALPPGAAPPAALPPAESDRLDQIANADDPIAALLGETKDVPDDWVEAKARPKGGDPFARQRAAHAELTGKYIADLEDQIRALFRRQEKVILSRLTGAKARKHTRHWTPKEGTAPTGRELKALDPAYVVDRARWIDEVVREITSIVEAAFGAAGLWTVRSLGGDGPFDGGKAAAAAVAQTVRIIAEGFDARAGRLQDIVKTADESGKNIEEIAAQVQQAFTNVDTWAQVTSRQVVGAMNAASQVAAADAGALKKRWLATDDERTRETHRKAEGQVVDIDGKFDVGEGELLFPGDPTGPVGEWINCRCTMLFQTAERDFDAELDSDLAALDVAEGKALVGRVVGAVRGFDLPTFRFVPSDHPRDYRGRFIDTPDVTLPDGRVGVAVSADSAGNVSVALPDGDVVSVPTKPSVREAAAAEVVKVDGPVFAWHGRLEMVPQDIAKQGSDAIREYLYAKFTGPEQELTAAREVPDGSKPAPVTLKPGDKFDTFLGPAVAGPDGSYFVDITDDKGTLTTVHVTPPAHDFARKPGRMQILATASAVDKPVEDAPASLVSEYALPSNEVYEDGDMPFLGTEDWATFDERLGNCYELSAVAATIGGAPEGSLLVYGAIQGGQNQPIGHGWVELPNGNLWEPISHTVYSPDNFAAQFAGIPFEKYSREDATRKLIVEGNYGPWFDHDLVGLPNQDPPTIADFADVRAAGLKAQVMGWMVTGDVAEGGAVRGSLAEPVPAGSLINEMVAPARSLAVEDMPKDMQYTHRLSSFGTPFRVAMYQDGVPAESSSQYFNGHPGLVGFVDAYRQDDGTVNIGYVATRPGFERQGIASAVMDKAVEGAPEIDVGEVMHNGAGAIVQRWLDEGRKVRYKGTLRYEPPRPSQVLPDNLVGEMALPRIVPVGEGPIPEGTIRLYHYTPLDNADSIRAQGLLESRARGDGGLGAGNEPSAGVWASTRPPNDFNADSTYALVEFWARPDQISQRAESPLRVTQGLESLEEWQAGYHHVIMNGDVPPEQFVAVHEPWEKAYEYMAADPDALTNFAWVMDQDGREYEQYKRAYRRLQAERGLVDERAVLVPSGTFHPEDHPIDFRGNFTEPPLVTGGGVTGIATRANDDGTVTVLTSDGETSVPVGDLTEVTEAEFRPSLLAPQEVAPTSMEEVGGVTVSKYEPRTYGGREYARDYTPIVIDVDGDLSRSLVQGKSGDVFEVCGRCGGDGYIPSYGHVYEGVCFQCRGVGLDRNLGPIGDAVKRIKRRVADRRRRERKREAEAAKWQAEREAWKTANVETLDALVPYREWGQRPWSPVRDDLSAIAAEADVGVQINIDRAKKLLARQAEVEAAQAARQSKARYAGQVGDKVSVTGKVRVAKYMEPQQYGWSSSMFLVVEGTGDDEGVTVKTFGSGSTLFGVGHGDTVTLTGSIKSLDEYEGLPQTTLTRTKATIVEANPEVTSERVDDPGGARGALGVLFTAVMEAWATIDREEPEGGEYEVLAYIPAAPKGLPLPDRFRPAAASILSYEDVFKNAIIEGHAGDDDFTDDVASQIRSGQLVASVTFDAGTGAAAVKVGVETKDHGTWDRDFTHVFTVSEDVTEDNADTVFRQWLDWTGVQGLQWRIPGVADPIEVQGSFVDEVGTYDSATSQALLNVGNVTDFAEAHDYRSPSQAVEAWKVAFRAERKRLLEAEGANDQEVRRLIVRDTLGAAAAEDVDAATPKALYGVRYTDLGRLHEEGFTPGPGAVISRQLREPVRPDGRFASWADAAAKIPEGEVVPVRGIDVQGSKVNGWATKRGGMPMLAGIVAPGDDGGRKIADMMFKELQSTWQQSGLLIPDEHAQTVRGLAWLQHKKTSVTGYGDVVATGGEGTVTFWRYPPSVHTMVHETAHNVDSDSGMLGGDRLVREDGWLHAVTNDKDHFNTVNRVFQQDTPTEAERFDIFTNPLVYEEIRGPATMGSGPTEYGRASLREDFAESYAMYLRDRSWGRLGVVRPSEEWGLGTSRMQFGFADLYPHRARYFDALTGHEPAPLSEFGKSRVATVVAAGDGPIDEWSDAMLRSFCRTQGISPANLDRGEMLAALRRIPGMDLFFTEVEAAA